MDYEKAYNEALERAREIKSKILSSHLSTESCKAVSEYIDTIIPELAESEDKKIRKAIEDIIRVYGKTQGEWIAGYDMDTLVIHLREAFSAFEKQKEHSLRDFIDDFPYSDKQKEQWPDIMYCPRDCKNCSAKCLYRKEQNPKQSESHIDWSCIGEYQNIPKEDEYEVVEKGDATGLKRKEQEIDEYPLCETIKDKIKYYIANHFIADKVVTTDMPSIVHAMEEGVRLGKEEQTDGKAMLHVAEKSYQIGLRDGRMEQKPEEWDEEDEQIYNSFKVFCQRLIKNKKETFEADPCYAQKMLTWLKSIPLKLKKKNEDVAKLCSNKWNEEDEDNLKRAINICINDFGEKSRIAKFLKSLPERFNLYSKQEWNKEDECKIKWLINLVGSQDTLSNEWKDECIDWLKSLRPQPHWKPSEEQIEALEIACTIREGERNYYLHTLYDDLKKL